MKIGEALTFASKTLAQAGIDESRQQAQWMLCAVLRVSRSQLLLNSQEELDDRAWRLYQSDVGRREKGEPMQYILGNQNFMGHSFYVDERVLIPRLDTEVLCQQAIEVIGKKPLRVLDLCTGSGCIGISIALACPQAQVSACDISNGALSVAQKNACILGAKLAFYQGDLLEAVTGQVFDVIVSNPPYIPAMQIDTLSMDVQNEPRLALDGGTSGMNFYRRIAGYAPAQLSAGGYLLLEVGEGQAEKVALLLQRKGLQTRIVKDLCAVNRVVLAKKMQEKEV